MSLVDNETELSKLSSLFYLVDKLQRTHNGCDKQILKANAGTPPQIGLTIGFMRC